MTTAVARPTWRALKSELMPKRSDLDLPRRVRRSIAIGRLHIRRRQWLAKKAGASR